MFLVLSIALAIIGCAVTWWVAYKAANPHLPPYYSKTVGWVAGAAGFPFFCGAVYCIYQVFGEPGAVGALMVFIFAACAASGHGEARGKLERQGIHRITRL